MPASLDHLRTFVAVMRTGSFTAAARLVGISQSTITHQMHALEHHIGYSLFTRTGRGISPTSRARSLMSHVAASVDELEAIIDRDDSASHGRRIIHLGGPAEYMTARVIPILPQLADDEGVDFRLSFGLADALLDGLTNGLFDIVVSSVFPRRRGVAITPLVDEEFVLVAAPVWRERLPEPSQLTAEFLENIPFVAYSEDLEIIRRYWRTVFFRSASAVHVAATIPNLNALSAAVAAGMGASVFPRYLIETELLAGTLVELFSPEIAPLNTLFIATREGAHQRDPVIRMLNDALLHDAHGISPAR